jgi:hypothetical protein
MGTSVGQIQGLTLAIFSACLLPQDGNSHVGLKIYLDELLFPCITAGFATHLPDKVSNNRLKNRVRRLTRKMQTQVPHGKM